MREPRNTRKTGNHKTIWPALGFVCFVLFVVHEARSWEPSVAAQDVTENELETASRGRTVRVRTGANGSTATMALPLEVYIARVLAGEAEPRAGAAAQEALAIAIRTFAAANAGRHRRDGFDLCDSTHCQVMRQSSAGSRLAALATASQLLTYEGKPVAVFYSASCGGRSELPSQVWPGAPDVPYLRAADDEVHSEEDAWVVDIPRTRVEQALRRSGFLGRALRDLDVRKRSNSGRVTLLGVVGLQPEVIRGEDFRAAVGARELRSTQFTVERDGGTFRFTGRGYGHGVGMCVIGAGRRAARGETTKEILQQYYPGLHVQPVVSSSHAVVAEPVREHEPTAMSPARDEGANELAQRARLELSTALGIASAAQIRIEAYESLEAFRIATGRPWWVTVAVTGSVIELAPPLLGLDRSEFETSVRRAVAEVLLTEPLAGRPAWVRIGAARYYATTQQSNHPPRRVKCPTDAELLMPVSAPAHRDAELRAEACFARALAKTGGWRNVR